MANDITPEQSTRIDRFSWELEGRTREIAIEYLAIPNTPDCQPEMMALHLKFGGELRRVTNLIESLREKFDLHYDVLQLELQKRLYN